MRGSQFSATEMARALVILFFIEVKLPYGRLHNIPFALFLIVDVATLLMISCLFHPPWKVLIGIAGAVCLWVAVQFVTSNDVFEETTESESIAPEPIGFFSEATGTHANIELPLNVDKALSLVIVTPNMHKFHHHFERPWTDTNFGNVLSCWDRMFGTFSVFERTL